jgi:hypothetical protein
MENGKSKITALKVTPLLVEEGLGVVDGSVNHPLPPP